MNLSRAEIGDVRARFPRVFAAQLLRRMARWFAILLATALVVVLARRLDLLSMKFIDGLTNLGTILQSMWPPAAETMGPITKSLAETIGMAFAGTLFAALIALPLGFLGARTVVHNRPAHFALRRVFDFFRGIPALIWALVFARAVGLGPMTGVLAFIAADFAALAKLYAEAIEASDTRALDGVRATGAARLATLRFGLLPQVLPVMLSQALYFFESNVRSASILGIVGAGGIGGVLQEAIRFNQWREVALILIVLFVVVFVLDQISRALREALIGRAS